jgi:hypothetical protein
MSSRKGAKTQRKKQHSEFLDSLGAFAPLRETLVQPTQNRSVIYGLLFGKLPALRATVIALKTKQQFTFQEANPNAPKTPVFHRSIPDPRACFRHRGPGHATSAKTR